MATLKRTAVICKEEYEFNLLTRLLHEKDVNEYYLVSSLESLISLDNFDAVIYLSSAKELEDFTAIVEEVHIRGVAQRWQ